MRESDRLNWLNYFFLEIIYLSFRYIYLNNNFILASGQ